MSCERQERDARKAASRYAPEPEASMMMYGIVGVSLFAVGAWGLSRFYAIPLLPHVIVLGICGILSFAFAMWLRRHRARRHDKAFRSELDHPLISRQEEETG